MNIPNKTAAGGALYSGKWETGIFVVKNSQLKFMLELILKIKSLNYWCYTILAVGYYKIQ